MGGKLLRWIGEAEGSRGEGVRNKTFIFCEANINRRGPRKLQLIMVRPADSEGLSGGKGKHGNSLSAGR